MGGLITMLVLLLALVIPTVIYEGTAQLCRRMKEEASFRKMLKGI